MMTPRKGSKHVMFFVLLMCYYYLLDNTKPLLPLVVFDRNKLFIKVSEIKRNKHYSEINIQRVGRTFARNFQLKLSAWSLCSSLPPHSDSYLQSCSALRVVYLWQVSLSHISTWQSVRKTNQLSSELSDCKYTEDLWRGLKSWLSASRSRKCVYDFESQTWSRLH
jgi:hypothetical protein